MELFANIHTFGETQVISYKKIDSEYKNKLVRRCFSCVITQKNGALARACDNVRPFVSKIDLLTFCFRPTIIATCEFHNLIPLVGQDSGSFLASVPTPAIESYRLVFREFCHSILLKTAVENIYVDGPVNMAFRVLVGGTYPSFE